MGDPVEELLRTRLILAGRLQGRGERVLRAKAPGSPPPPFLGALGSVGAMAREMGSGDRIRTQSRVFLKPMFFKKYLFIWLCQVLVAVGGI